MSDSTVHDLLFDALQAIRYADDDIKPIDLFELFDAASRARDVVRDVEIRKLLRSTK